jgi:superfamily II DNA or RNA helicase
MQTNQPHVSKRIRGKILPPPLIPYDYQAPIIKKMIEQILAGKNGLIIQPTATGKSVEAAFVARTLILFHRKKGLYLYDENEGLNQARLKFEEIFNKNDILCANFFGYGKDSHVEEADIVFASFQSLNNHHGKSYLKFDQMHFDYIIVNEAHHGQAVTYKEVLDYFECPKIGMTATPIRMDGKDILDIFNEVLYEILLEEAIVKGWVARLEYHIMSHGLSTQKLKKICEEVLEEGKRISIKQLNETIFIEALDDEVKKEIYRYAFPEEGKPRQTLIFCESIDHAKHFLELLLKDGMVAECVHSKRTTHQNRVSMDHFRQGKIQFLLSVDKLNEDIDVPNVELGVFLRATDSLTVFLQQMGRLLRKTRTKDRAIILDFVANAERLILVQQIVERIQDLSQDDNIPFEKEILRIKGEGFDFNFTDEIVNVIGMLQVIKEGSFAPDGWITPNALKENYVAGVKTIRKFAETFKLDHPEWFCNYFNVSGKLTEYYHPDLVKLILERFKREKKELPDDWVLPKHCLGGTSISDPAIRNFAEKFRKDHPEWFDIFWFINGYYEFYHPELVNLIREEFKNRKPPLEGWKTAKTLSNEKVGYPTSIKGFAEKFRKDHPEWFEMFTVINGRMYEHYHPDLISEIKKEFQIRKPGDSWSTVSGLAKEIGIEKQLIVSYIDQFLKDNPGLVMEYKTKSATIRHLHPNLVEKIKEWTKDKIIDDTWFRAQDLAKEEIASWSRIRHYAEQFQNDHPEWFRLRGRMQYYHPDLVKLIREGFKNSIEDAPSGWYTRGKLTILQGYSKVVNEYIESFRVTNPEYFKDYRISNGRIHEHYHPDLLEKLKLYTEELYKPPPEGWVTLLNLNDAFGVSSINPRIRPLIREFVEQFRNDGLVKSFLGPNGWFDYYHPDLVQKIKEHFAKKK